MGAELEMESELVVSEYMEAAALRLEGVPMIVTRQNERGRIEFIFGNMDGCAATVQRRFRSGLLMVNAQRFAAEIQAVKALIFSTKQ